jgi:hypothetical protein
MNKPTSKRSTSEGEVSEEMQFKPTLKMDLVTTMQTLLLLLMVNVLACA